MEFVRHISFICGIDFPVVHIFNSLRSEEHLEVLSYQNRVVDGSFERLIAAIRKLPGDDTASPS